LYRLISPRDGSPYSATQSISSDGRQAVLFAFLHSSSMLYPYPRIHLKSLDPQARYRLRVLAGKPEEGTPVEASGGYWMSDGIQLMLKGDFQAAAIVLDRATSSRGD
jgi:alpha-galactosidase